ncbi:MAG: linear amide C-N hydrolase, partial [Mycobacterium sp.]
MCTRVLWNTNGLAVLTGRSMDWPESTQPLIVAFPPGRQRDGFQPAGVGDDPNPLRWTSRYASLVTTIYGVGTIDGLNSAGLAGHGLYLQATDFGTRNPARPAVQTTLWLQYLLDRAATVEEALALMEDIELVKITVRGHDSNIHLALEDSSGDSAIVELADGRPVIHHGRQFTLMTNDPTYDEQLALLSQQDFTHPSRDMPLPGNVNAVDRFQRA